MGRQPILPKQEVENMTATMSEDELQSRKFAFLAQMVGLFTASLTCLCMWLSRLKCQESGMTHLTDRGLTIRFAHWYAVDYDGNIFALQSTIGKRYCISCKCNQKHLPCAGTLPIMAWLRRWLTRQQTSARWLRLKVWANCFEHGIATTNVNKDLFAGIARVKQN